MAKLLTILPGNSDNEKLDALGATNYKQQAIWFLNAFWDNISGQAEDIWKYTHKYEDLDIEKRADGNGLDELNAHRFLEFFKDTHTVQELRQKLRETGAIAPNQRPKLVPIIHFLLFKFGVDYHTLVNASQGDNSKEIAEAERLLAEVSAAFEEADRTAKAAAAALAEAKATEAEATSREAAAKKAEAEAIEQEAPFKKAQEEVDSALAEVKSQETARDNKTAELQRKSTEGGVVQQNKAKAELAQHLAEDPLPLRKAKITLEAALKRAEKARAPFEAATKAAEAARAAAVAAADAARAAKAASERAKAAADAAVDEAGRRLAEAEAYLNEIKSRPGCAHGAIWWMDRELTERKAYLPESKGGYRKAK